MTEEQQEQRLIAAEEAALLTEEAFATTLAERLAFARVLGAFYQELMRFMSEERAWELVQMLAWGDLK